MTLSVVYASRCPLLLRFLSRSRACSLLLLPRLAAAAIRTYLVLLSSVSFASPASPTVALVRFVSRSCSSFYIPRSPTRLHQRPSDTYTRAGFANARRWIKCCFNRQSGSDFPEMRRTMEAARRAASIPPGIVNHVPLELLPGGNYSSDTRQSAERRVNNGGKRGAKV